MNAATGIIIWEDWKVVGSWTGYASVFVLLLLGVYLLSTVDVFEHYDSLVEQGHVTELGMVESGSDDEYKPIVQTDVEMRKGDSKYGAVSGAGGASTKKSEPTTHQHRVFFRHKPWHLFKLE
jgi:hypothetical protein